MICVWLGSAAMGALQDAGRFGQLVRLQRSRRQPSSGQVRRSAVWPARRSGSYWRSVWSPISNRDAGEIDLGGHEIRIFLHQFRECGLRPGEIDLREFEQAFEISDDFSLALGSPDFVRASLALSVSPVASAAKNSASLTAGILGPVQVCARGRPSRRRDRPCPYEPRPAGSARPRRSAPLSRPSGTPRRLPGPRPVAA